MNRVVITGLGCVTPIGSTSAGLWASLEAGRTGVLPIPIAHEGAAPDSKLRFSNVGLVTGLDLPALSSTQITRPLQRRSGPGCRKQERSHT